VVLDKIKCHWCGSRRFRKIGIRRLVNRQKQIYYCRDCKRKFTGNYIPGQEDPHFKTERKTYSQNWPAYNAA